MKKFLLVGCLLFCISVMYGYTNKPSWDTSTEEGKKASEFYSNQKIYIHPTQIHAGPNGMYIDFAGDFCRVSKVYEDENGFFVKDLDFWWKCPKGHPNPPWRLTCQVCNPDSN